MLSQYSILSPCMLSTRSWKEKTEQSGVDGTTREFTARLKVCLYTEFLSCQRYVKKQNYIPNFSPKSSFLKDIFFSSPVIWLSYLYSVLFLERYGVYIWSLNRKKIKEQVKVRASPLFPGLKKNEWNYCNRFPSKQTGNSALYTAGEHSKPWLVSTSLLVSVDSWPSLSLADNNQGAT